MVVLTMLNRLIMNERLDVATSCLKAFRRAAIRQGGGWGRCYAALLEGAQRCVVRTHGGARLNERGLEVPTGGGGK